MFYSDVRSLIQSIQITGGASPQVQNQNVGDGEFYGFEISFDTAVSARFDVGGNYTYTNRHINYAISAAIAPLQPAFRLTGVPKNKAFFYAAWRPVSQLTLTPSLEIASDRWSDKTTTPAQAFPYTIVGAYTLVNFSAEYRLVENVRITAGAKNLFDSNYELSWGMPQQGRTYYFKGRVTF